MEQLYPWIVFGHIAGAFVFAMSHGVGAWSSFRLDRERDPVRVRALLELMGESLAGVYVGLLILLIFGIWAGIIGGHFARAWIWVSVRLPLVPLVMTWKKIGTLTVIAAGALPLADAGMSRTT